MSRSKGVTLIEVLIVMAILAVLILAGFVAVMQYLPKARDAKRKSDLVKLKQVFQDYYNDNGEFPPAAVLDEYCTSRQNTYLTTYLKQLPCDPLTKKAYLYQPYKEDDASIWNKGFRILTKLENLKDPVIVDVNCSPTDGCGLGAGLESYVYGVSEGVPVSTLGVASTPNSSWVCWPRGNEYCKDWSGSTPCEGNLYATLELCHAAGGL